ncbi:ABC transporter permease [Mesorhizobium sp. 113-1-2]|uniref:ABC transporter permease n=1 Tax=Mesorhizobium sp. 113-1-2 TaxID=2744515 RepID=UPI001925BD97|nr:ABC transporter permease [Mesorhizobium sp. 113-1-2]BCG76166.1 ABC transporter permease [Mesorhizobium sp. 113-1-2]
MRTKRNIDAVLAVFLIAVIVVTTVFLIVPVVVTVFMAFDARNYMGPFPPPALSGRWFGKLVNDAYLWSGFVTSLLLAAATTVIATVIGGLAAIAMSDMTPRWRDFFSSAFLSPLALPGVIIGFALLMFFSVFNVLPPFPRLLIGHVLITTPYTIRMTLIGLMNINRTLREAALSLGANDRQAFFTVTLPLAKSGIAAGAIFAFAFSMDDVAISLFLSDFKTYTFPVALLGLMRSNFDLTIAAAAVVLMGLTVVLLVVLDRVLGLERAMGLSISGE